MTTPNYSNSPKQVESAGICPARITSKYVCSQPHTKLMQGVPLCPVHRKTLAFFGRLRLPDQNGEQVWLHASPEERIELPDYETNPSTRIQVDALNFRNDGPAPATKPVMPTAPAFADVAPIDGAAAQQASLF